MYVNHNARSWRSTSATPTPEVEDFHRLLPHYSETPLVSLDSLANGIGAKHLFVKDESLRFGLPSFKILGASWAVYRAIAKKTGHDIPVSLQQLSESAAKQDVMLVCCSAGNWGRAVARMALYLKIPAVVFVSRYVDQATRNIIAGEGAEVRVVDGGYDASVEEAKTHAEDTGSLLCMDTSWPGYEEIPAWVADGYSTMLAETDRQLHDIVGRPATCVVASVGVGSFAAAVAAHYKQPSTPSTAVIAVEPTGAACLHASLNAGRIVSIETGETIMCGMNCGTVSTIAWPKLRDGVDASVTVTDREAHEDTRLLGRNGVRAGPCGSATLSALRKVVATSALPTALGPEAIVVVFCTEGQRVYLESE
ncbi:tryptophan synthase beta subunit-like PLP-dependent enzyme [Lineolata rhizophorae]|uniref:Tryptophan synthase beta subunit-like PLP-dependent enzyme n=1 Tax=Lineolata rhizophorae TaxID=578093 RepID=A0A6A6NV43_9PEZI|nr:tryptophan synthase beta subunit-like PLP-dependent enzyme [Lineolata rhizophorae]